jgi:hypothetical protein
MSDRLEGWFAVDRKSVSHPFFKRSERSEYEAWIWIIAHAAWKETHHYVNGKRHDVKRGELFTTLRKLQAEWMWSSDKKVRGFLKRLTDERMIDAETSAGKTQITICNYSLYQDVGRKKDAEMSEKSPAKGQAKDAIKEQTKQINNLTTNNNSSLHSELSPKTENRFDEFWAVFADKRGKQAALKVWKKKKLDAIADQVISGAKRYIQIRDADQKFWKQAQGWLNDERWTDEVSQTHNTIDQFGNPSNITGFPQGGQRKRRSDVEIMIERGNALRERGL